MLQAAEEAQQLPAAAPSKAAKKHARKEAAARAAAAVAGPTERAQPDGTVAGAALAVEDAADRLQSDSLADVSCAAQWLKGSTS